MTYDEAVKMLAKCGQEHVLAFWKKLGKNDREALLAQIAKIEPKSVAQCAKTLQEGAEVPDSSKGKAPKVAVLKGKALAAAVATGEKELRAGRVAALLVAGGQGSRLGYDGPKGCYEIGPITNAPMSSGMSERSIFRKEGTSGTPNSRYCSTTATAASMAIMVSFVTFVLSDEVCFAFADMMIHPFNRSMEIIRGERNEPVNCSTGSNSINDESSSSIRTVAHNI